MNQTILVVEDERPLLEAIKIRLEHNGFTVKMARTTNEALSIINTAEPTELDAVWLDHYLLGKEDGLDFVAKMKNMDAWKSTPIFVVSNTASADKVQSYLQFGVEKYYVKSQEKLETIINDIATAIHS